MNNKGFTLIEILVGMVITVIVVFFIISFAADITDSSLRLGGSLFTQQQLQQTLQVMVPEIRSVGQSSVGAYPIEIATSTEFSFYSDIDRDGKFEKVRYFLDNTTFKKGIIVPTGEPLVYDDEDEEIFPLVDSIVVGPQIFSYYDIDATSTQSTQLSTPVDVLKIRMVKITLVANQGTAGEISIVGAEDQATIRNLRYK